jgi:segregation and condensation protein A
LSAEAAASETLLPQAAQPAQQEMPFAIVQGEPLLILPQDLYIPPDALEVFLDAFEGPLDLLLYLIKRQNLDILDIPIAQITEQYMEYVELMKDMRLELAAEYLVMAAMLAEIKSRMLLPRPPASEDEEDPRAELVRRLQEYERFKKAAQDLEELPRLERDFFTSTRRSRPATCAGCHRRWTCGRFCWPCATSSPAPTSSPAIGWRRSLSVFVSACRWYWRR